MAKPDENQGRTGRPVITASASRKGSRAFNCDSAATAETATRVAAALIDVVDNNETSAATAPLLAEVAARVAAVRGGLAGLLTAGSLLHVDGAPDAVGVVAVTGPGAPVSIAWAGDARAYAWDGRELRQYTTDHTVGEQLRQNGAPWELAADHDNWLQSSLGVAVVASVYEVDIPPGPAVVLTSDGVHDHTPHNRLEDFVRTHAEDPHALAEALVEAAVPDATGYRDDATAMVISPAAH